MWVVYNSQTGIEYDTYTTAHSAYTALAVLNSSEDYDRNTFSVRKED